MIEKQTKRSKELGFSVYKCWGLKQTFVQCRRERLQNQNIHSLLFSLSPLFTHVREWIERERERKEEPL